MLVTAFTCSTFLSDRGSCFSPIQTPSSHPIAMSERPSMVAEKRQHAQLWNWKALLTEWTTAGNASGVQALGIVSRSGVVGRHEE